MYKFVKYLLNIFLVLLLMVVVLDLVYTYTIKNSPPRNKISYALSLKNKHYDAVFIGSSRVANTIVTSEFNKKGLKVLNLGEEGAVLNDNLLVLSILVKNKITFSKLFIQLDYLYNSESKSTLSTIGKSNALPFIREPFIKAIFKLEDPDYFKNYYLPFYRYAVNGYKIGFREFFNCLIQKEPRIALEDGFIPKYGTRILSKATLPNYLTNTPFVYNNINDFCKENNFNTIYFTAPFCSKLEGNNFTNKLADKVFNYYDYSTFVTQDEFFVDCRHLNSEGAKKFTKKIITTFFDK